MSKIIAIGGGEIGRPGYSIETLKIDKEIIKLSKKKNPKVLFIPTASSDSKSYCNTFQDYFGKRLKCQVDILYLINNNLSQREISKKILSSDIIYVGGGNTLKMMNIWRRKGVDKILKKAFNRDIVLSGISAGAICWFKYGLSDSRKFKNKDSDYIRVSGLNFINMLNCPHYDVESDRREDLKRIMKKTKVPALTLDNCCAIEIIDNRYRIITSKDGAQANLMGWENNEYIESKIKVTNSTRPLKSLSLV